MKEQKGSIIYFAKKHSSLICALASAGMLAVAGIGVYKILNDEVKPYSEWKHDDLVEEIDAWSTNPKIAERVQEMLCDKGENVTIDGKRGPQTYHTLKGLEREDLVKIIENLEKFIKDSEKNKQQQNDDNKTTRVFYDHRFRALIRENYQILEYP